MPMRHNSDDGRATLNLRQLAYFRAVVEHGSLAAASDVLRVAQPNLSVAIRQLESEWGVALFDRIGRGLSLTDTGQILYERAAQLLGTAAAVEQEMQAIGKGASARVRIGFTAVSIDPITRMIGAHQAASGVSFSLHQGEPRLLEAMVESRDLDFAVTHMPVANPALHVRPAAAPVLMLLARDDERRWRYGETVRLEDLSDVPVILLKRSSGTGIFDQVREAFEQAGTSSHVLADCTDMTAIHALVLSGAGVGLVPMLKGSHTPAGLVAHAMAHAPPLERLAIISPRGRRLLPAVQAAMDRCRDFLGGAAEKEADART